MELWALVDTCFTALKSPIAPGAVAIVLPGKWGKQTHKRLAGREGPLGEIVEENADGTVVVMFQATEVLMFIHDKITKPQS